MIEFYLQDRADSRASMTLIGFQDMRVFTEWVKKIGGVRLIPNSGDRPITVVVDHGKQR